MRFLARLLTVTILAIAGIATAQDAPDFKDVIVRFTILADGTMQMTERLEVTVPPSAQVIERTYPAGAELSVKVERVVRIGPDGSEEWILERGNLDAANQFADSEPGKIVWSVRDKSATAEDVQTLVYLLETRVTGAVIPALSIPRGQRSVGVNDPRDRFRTLLPIWKKALQRPRARYLIDYDYQTPPLSTSGTNIQLQLYWKGEWEPVDEITGDTIGTKTETDTHTFWRVTHLFDYRRAGTPAAVDMRLHLVRMGSIALFPAVGLLFWLIWLGHEVWRRRGAPSGEVDENVLRATIYSEAPEVIAARWSGKAPRPRLEPFLRRLEQQRKVSIDVRHPGPDAAEEEDIEVSVKLLVPRDQLNAYDRAAIDALMPAGWEITTAAIRQRYGENDVFDPTDSLLAELKKIADESSNLLKMRWYSRLLSAAFFWGGLVLLGLEAIGENRAPLPLIVTVVSGTALAGFWPNTLIRKAIRRSLLGALLPLIGLVLVTTLLVALHLAFDPPLRIRGSLGLSVFMLAMWKGMLSHSSTSQSRDALRRELEIARARRWMRAELQRETPRLRDDIIPWLHALGLEQDVARWRVRHAAPDSRFAGGRHWTGQAPQEEEPWAFALMA